MNIWKQRVIRIIYFHHRLIAMGILFIGGCLALWVVYQFLFKDTGVESVKEDPAIAVTVNKKALDRVADWNMSMRQQSTVEIAIPNSVFSIPAVVSQ